MKILKISQKILYLSFACLALILGVIYWLYSSRFVSTDDAYVNANIVQVAARVTGEVTKLHVMNNQYVQKGQLLFELDDEPFKVALAKAKAEEALSGALLKYSELSATRTEVLFARKALPAQAYDKAIAQLQSALAGVELTKTDVNRAQLNLAYTKVYAATNGWVTNMNLREGNLVNANQLLFALVSSDEFWVDANFKETELESVKVGQKAEVLLDMYSGHAFKGVVESISSGSGAAFSLLPAQNATGNWVKITQRVPVKVRILDVDQSYPLRVGATAAVTINIH